MLGLLIAARLAQAADPLPAGVPEPVLDLAVADLRAERRSRIALALGVAAPGALVFGALSYPRGSEPGDGRSNQRIGAGAAAILGGAGMIVAPLWLDNRAQASRRALRSQGLPVRRLVPAGIVPVLTVIGPVAALIGSGQEGAGLVIGGSVTYVTALGLGVLQQRANGRARAEAPWLVVSPTFDRDATGFAVGGAW